MESGAGTDAMADDIVAAGHTPVLLDGTNWDMIGQIDSLYVWNGNNTSYRQDLVDHMPAITDAVQAGMNLIVFDRAIGEIGTSAGTILNPSTILPGAERLEVERHLSDDADLTDAGEVMIGGGPAPGVSDTSLDGGSYTTHGYALTDTLPDGATVLMTPANGAGDQAVGFVYAFGAGMVQYYGIPLDHYDQVDDGWDNPWQNFAINTLVAISICIEENVPVMTANGLRAIGKLRPGDLVATLDHGLQDVLWIERDPVPRDLIEVPPGVLQNRLPLLLTAQHRVLIASPLAELGYGATEVLLPAAALAEAGLARRMGQGVVCNLLLPHHDIIFAAGGAPVESLLPTPAVRRALSREGRAAAVSIRPHNLRPARPLLTTREGTGLLRWLHPQNSVQHGMAQIGR